MNLFWASLNSTPTVHQHSPFNYQAKSVLFLKGVIILVSLRTLWPWSSYCWETWEKYRQTWNWLPIHSNDLKPSLGAYMKSCEAYLDTNLLMRVISLSEREEQLHETWCVIFHYDKYPIWQMSNHRGVEALFQDSPFYRCHMAYGSRPLAQTVLWEANYRNASLLWWLWPVVSYGGG